MTSKPTKKVKLSLRKRVLFSLVILGVFIGLMEGVVRVARGRGRQQGLEGLLDGGNLSLLRNALLLDDRHDCIQTLVDRSVQIRDGLGVLRCWWVLCLRNRLANNSLEH